MPPGGQRKPLPYTGENLAIPWPFLGFLIGFMVVQLGCTPCHSYRMYFSLRGGNAFLGEQRIALWL